MIYTKLSEIEFSADELSDCLLEAAKWISENDMKYKIRGIISQYDNENMTWYLGILIYP